MVSYRRFLLYLLAIATLIICLQVGIVTASAPALDKAAREITVRIEGTARGSGAIVERRGQTYTVVTNAHVLQNTGNYGIVAPDGKCYAIAANTIKQLPQLDLAIFLFSSDVAYSVARLGNTAQLSPGQTVYVGGWANSGGRLQSRVFLTSEGQITEVNSQLPSGYSLTYTNLVRVGMSGGPVLDQQGRVIGINGIVRFASNDSDAIVASGIKIDRFEQLHSQLIKTIPLPAASKITCPRKYIN